MFNIGDVTMRDGLQGIKQTIDTSAKISMIDKLSNAGYRYIEVGSIVSARHVPQMKDSEIVYRSIKKHNDVKYGLLAIGKKNILRTINHIEPESLGLVTTMSEEFCGLNMGITVDESVKEIADSLEYAKKAGIKHTRVYISCCSTCPITRLPMYMNVGKFIKRLPLHLIDDLMLSDTSAGMNEYMMQRILKDIRDVRDGLVGLHLHENKHSLSIIKIAIMNGIYNFDTTFAKLGGCVVLKEPHNNISVFKLLDNVKGVKNVLDHDVIKSCRDDLNLLLDSQ
jgi:hydroxymethylglutaryl-CoA lyase